MKALFHEVSELLSLFSWQVALLFLYQRLQEPFVQGCSFQKIILCLFSYYPFVRLGRGALPFVLGFMLILFPLFFEPLFNVLKLFFCILRLYHTGLVEYSINTGINLLYKKVMKEVLWRSKGFYFYLKNKTMLK